MGFGAKGAWAQPPAPELAPRTLALMHGPSFSGDGAAALLALAGSYDDRVLTARPAAAG